MTSVLLLMLLAAHQEAAPSPNIWDGVFTAEQSKRGQELYKKECAACHTEQLTGGETAPPLAGGEFLSNWNGLTVGDLFERIRKTMPSSKPGKLSRAVNADITAFLLNFNNFPEGKIELSDNTDKLKQIRIDTQKPEKKK